MINADEQITGADARLAILRAEEAIYQARMMLSPIKGLFASMNSVDTALSLCQAHLRIQRKAIQNVP